MATMLVSTRQEAVEKITGWLQETMTEGKIIPWSMMALQLTVLLVHGLFAIAEAIERKRDVS